VNNFNLFPSTRKCVIQNKSIGLHCGYDGDNSARPILEARIDPLIYGGSLQANTHDDYVYQGAYIFQISTGEIKLRGRITHLRGDELLKSGYWLSSEHSVYRCLYIGENLYTISGRMVKISSLSDLSELKAIPLN